MSMIKAVKFGGSSLADAAHFQKAVAIITSDSSRRYVVVSAPGKRMPTDVKVTDLLYRCYDAAAAGGDFSEPFAALERRFRHIIEDLHLDLDLSADFERIRHNLSTNPQREYAASRGEYLNGRIMSAYLGFPFLDAADCIFFQADGTLDSERTYSVLIAKLRLLPHAVVPGFYGSMPDGSIHTFSRGGSDVTGAIVARAAGADIYENWTDVSGMLMADPNLVPNPKPIPHITYTELRELAYLGAAVMHEDAVFPVKSAGIPINIRNTNAPEDPGTLISAKAEGITAGAITGIAGKPGYSVISLEKDMMNAEVGFGLKVLSVLARYSITFEHMPTGIDTMSLIVPTESLAPCREAVLQEIRNAVSPDTLTIDDGLALIVVAGHGMTEHIGMAAQVLSVVSAAHVNLKMIDMGSRELSLILAVWEPDYQTAIRAIYEHLC